LTGSIIEAVRHYDEDLTTIELVFWQINLKLGGVESFQGLCGVGSFLIPAV
jgi:hypothetical protein